LNLHVGTFLFGPHVEFRSEHFTPFVEGLFGLHRVAPQDVNFGANNAFGLATGGGLDVHVSRHLDLRLVQADYVYSKHNFGTVSVGSNTVDLTNNKWSGVRVQTGINLLLATGPTGPPPSVSCAVEPGEVYAGEPVRATATPHDFNPKRTLHYSWSATGGKVQGQDANANIDTTGLNPGSYTVTASVNDGKKANAQCNATYTVKERPKHPPQISCSANPATVQSGTPSTVTCDCKSPDTAPDYNVTTSITNWSASGGRISGTGNTATLDTAGAPCVPTAAA
jgi:hypothetical protein